VSTSSSGSGSGYSRGGGSGRSGSKISGQLADEGRTPMEVTTEIREDPPEEIAESSLPARSEYKWVVEDV